MTHGISGKVDLGPDHGAAPVPPTTRPPAPEGRRVRETGSDPEVRGCQALGCLWIRFSVASKCTPFIFLMPSAVRLYTVRNLRSESLSIQKYGVGVPFFFVIVILAMERSPGDGGPAARRGRTAAAPVSRSGRLASAYNVETFSAAGPLAPCTTSNSTRAPSLRLLKPEPWIAE